MSTKETVIASVFIVSFLISLDSATADFPAFKPFKPFKPFPDSDSTIAANDNSQANNGNQDAVNPSGPSGNGAATGSGSVGVNDATAGPTAGTETTAGTPTAVAVGQNNSPQPNQSLPATPASAAGGGSANGQLQTTVPQMVGSTANGDGSSLTSGKDAVTQSSNMQTSSIATSLPELQNGDGNRNVNSGARGGSGNQAITNDTVSDSRSPTSPTGTQGNASPQAGQVDQGLGNSGSETTTLQSMRTKRRRLTTMTADDYDDTEDAAAATNGPRRHRPMGDLTAGKKPKDLLGLNLLGLHLNLGLGRR